MKRGEGNDNIEQVAPADEYDSPWKEAIERYFEAFIAFFFPTRMRESIGPSATNSWTPNSSRWSATRSSAGGWPISWSTPGAKTARKRGSWCTLRSRDSARRSSRGGCTSTTTASSTASAGRWSAERFPIVKLLDYEARWDELEQSNNPFAVVVMAHLRSQATRQEPETRLQWKLRLVKGLYERGYSREDILELFRVIDWMMALPEELARSFDRSLEEYEGEKRMPYITSVERHGIEKGLQQGREQGRLQALREDVIDALETRFHAVPGAVGAAVSAIEDLTLLKDLHRRAITAADLEEFRAEFARLAERSAAG